MFFFKELFLCNYDDIAEHDVKRDVIKLPSFTWKKKYSLQKKEKTINIIAINNINERINN